MELNRRTLFMALTLAFVIMLVTGIASTLAGSSNGDLIKNGDFELGFRMVDGCGMVAKEWGCFQTGGAGGYGFYDDAWERVVATGAHAQLIEINTKEIGGDQNRTAGIYQTVDVVPGQTYTLAFNGMIRANDVNAGGDPWRYVMLVGFTHNGSTQWSDAQVQEVNVGPIQDRLNPTGYYRVQLNVTAQGSKLTVFIAGRMKWGDWYKEVNFDVDSVSLKGPRPGSTPPSPTFTPVPTATPIASGMLICDGPNLIQNGGFEKGFDADGTAKKWGKFNNGGLASYGYYQEKWGPVVAEGAHAQLLEINSKGFMPTDSDRWIGIHQRISGLTAGATYQLRLKTMIRERGDHGDEDAWRYEVYWGLNSDAGKIGDVAELEMLSGIPVSGIYLRTAPGPYTGFSTTFQAPTSEIRIYLLGLKKWATSEREVNFDFDAVELRQCRTVTINSSPADPPAPANHTATLSGGNDASHTNSAHAGTSSGLNHTQAPVEVCTYIVQPGDYISRIAEEFNTTVDWLMQNNQIPNSNLLFVGQPLVVPCGVNAAVLPAPANASPPPTQISHNAPATTNPPAPTNQEETTSSEENQRQRNSDTQQEQHVIVRGETLSQIAFRYGTTVQELRRVNQIKNPRLIRPGQVIKVPTR